MTAQTFKNATTPAFAFRARLRHWLTRLPTLTAQIELDPHLAADIGQSSYNVPVLPHGLVQAFKDAQAECRALAREQGDIKEIERCVCAYDAPVLAASWAQFIQEGAARSGWLHRALAMLSGLRPGSEATPLESLDRHLARDIGLEFEMTCVNLLRQGGF